MVSHQFYGFMQTSYLRSFLPCANLTCGGGLKVSLCDAGHRGFQRLLRRQHRHHPQLRVGPLSLLTQDYLELFLALFLSSNIFVWEAWDTCSQFTSLEESKVMMGVYVIIALTFTPNAIEFYQVTSVPWILPGNISPLNIYTWLFLIIWILNALSWIIYFPQIMRGEQHHLIKGPMARFWGGKGRGGDVNACQDGLCTF